MRIYNRTKHGERGQYESMKRLIFIGAMLLLLGACGTALPVKEADTSGTTWYAETDSTGAYYREGYLYTGLDCVRCGGETYYYAEPLSRKMAEMDAGGLKSAGAVDKTVDGVPENDLEAARDLDEGTELYMFENCPMLLFAEASESGYRVYTSSERLIHALDEICLGESVYAFDGIASDKADRSLWQPAGSVDGAATGSELLPAGTELYQDADNAYLFARYPLGSGEYLRYRLKP